MQKCLFREVISVQKWPLQSARRSSFGDSNEREGDNARGNDIEISAGLNQELPVYQRDWPRITYCTENCSAGREASVNLWIESIARKTKYLIHFDLNRGHHFLLQTAMG